MIFKMNTHKIKVITEELIISKADVDFNTNVEKREYVEYLEKRLMELLR